jgi:hypothetical protein
MNCVACVSTCHTLSGRRGSSVSIVPDYGLDDRGSIPGRGKGFIFCVQTGSEAHSTSCAMGTGVPFPGGKERPGRDADHSPASMPRSWMSRSYTSSLSLQVSPWRVVALLLHPLWSRYPFRNCICKYRESKRDRQSALTYVAMQRYRPYFSSRMSLLPVSPRTRPHRRNVSGSHGERY